MADDFIIRFWGVRGSYPVPGFLAASVGGNTSCVEVRVGGHLIILDAGTGIINLGQALKQEYTANDELLVATMLFSHTHHDHTQGFPFFEPAYSPRSVLYMFGPRTFYEDIEEALRRSMLSPAFPVALEELRSLKVISNIEESEAVVLEQGREPRLRNLHRDSLDLSADAVKITVMRSYAHPKEGVHIYRIEWRGRSVVYATDTESYAGGDTRLIRFTEGADLLVHDAQYTHQEYVGGPMPRQGWGHSTPEMAASIAQMAGVGRLVLFHHDPTHSDETLIEMETDARAVFPDSILARESLVLTL
ncbi:MAG: MBL fold metallo-hydrolase [Chloroflexota bacterium]